MKRAGIVSDDGSLVKMLGPPRLEVEHAGEKTNDNALLFTHFYNLAGVLMERTDWQRDYYFVDHVVAKIGGQSREIADAFETSRVQVINPGPVVVGETNNMTSPLGTVRNGFRKLNRT